MALDGRRGGRRRVRRDPCACVPLSSSLSLLVDAQSPDVARRTGADILFPVSALSFAADGRSLVLSAPPAPTSAGGTAGEGTFCVAYPVWSDDNVSLVDDDGPGERTWLSEDGEGLERDGGA